jgi:Domain of unknown function (DUF4440)
MQRTLSVIGTLLVIFTANAEANDTDALIALDKQWGESGTKGDTSIGAKLLADAVVSVDDTGVQGKQAVLANTTAAPAGTRYEPTDYKVTFVNADMAIMTHSTKGEDAHYSLHVWSRKSDAWQVVATSSTPVSKGK